MLICGTSGQSAAPEGGGAAAVSENAAALGGGSGEDPGGPGKGPFQVLPGELCAGPAASPETARG